MNDPETIDRLCRQWQGLCPWAIIRFFVPHLSTSSLNAVGGVEELIAIGNVALVRAAQNFDVSHGVQFNTYAAVAIRRYVGQYVERELRRQLPIAHSPDGDVTAMIDQVADDLPTAHDQAEANERAQYVAMLLRRLPPAWREIVRGRVMRGETLQTLADRAGISKERVRQIQERAIKELASMA